MDSWVICDWAMTIMLCSCIGALSISAIVGGIVLINLGVKTIIDIWNK